MKIRRTGTFLAVISLVLVLFTVLTGACAGPDAAPESSTPEASPAPQVYTIKYSAAFAADSTPYKYGEYLLDIVEERAQGRVETERIPGGVLGAPTEYLAAGGSGSLDMIGLGHVLWPEKLALHNYPMFVLGDAEEALEFGQNIELENPETSRLLQAEWAEHNLTFLSYMSSGQNAFAAKSSFSCLADCKGAKMGGGMPTLGEAYSQAGLVAASIDWPDLYESLSRGVIDLAYNSIGSLTDLRMYEVADCLMADGCFTYMPEFVMNLDTWNSLPGDIQEIFKDAARDMREHSLEVDATQTAELLKLWEDNGAVVGELPDDDKELLYRGYWEIWKKSAEEFCAGAGKSAECQVIWQYAEQQILGD